MDNTFVVHTPLMWINKEQTWALADELRKFEYVRDKTLTCYNGVIAEGCGECPACQLRKKGLDAYMNSKKIRKETVDASYNYIKKGER